MITESNKLLNDKIDSWTEALTERLIEIRFIDVAEIKTSLKTHFKMAMIDSLKMQISQTQVEHDEIRYAMNSYKGYEKAEKMKRLGELRIKLKAENKLYAELDRDRQAKEMALWMRKHHPESILSFYKMYDEKFPERTK
jgi:hypothetical protein